MAATKTASDKDGNLKAAAAYLPVFWPLIPLFLFLTEKEDKAVRFHSLQSIFYGLVVGVVMFAVLIVVWVITMVLAIVTGGLGVILMPLVGIVMLGVMLLLCLSFVFLMWKAYSGEKFMVPVIGPFAEKYV